MVGVGNDTLWIGPSSQSKQHDAPPPALRRIGQRKRQAAPAAYDGQGGRIVRCLWHLFAHGAAFVSAGSFVAAGVISGRDPLA